MYSITLNPLPDDPTWETVDNIVKQWLYVTLSQQVLQSILKSGSTAAEVWESIKSLFLENKDSKALDLEDELHSLSLGSSSIHDYCNKIKAISDLLKNIGNPVSKKNLVIHDLN